MWPWNSRPRRWTGRSRRWMRGSAVNDRVAVLESQHLELILARPTGMNCDRQRCRCRQIDMPHKHTAECRHHIPKIQFRVRNWAAMPGVRGGASRGCGGVVLVDAVHPGVTRPPGNVAPHALITKHALMSETRRRRTRLTAIRHDLASPSSDGEKPIMRRRMKIPTLASGT